MSILLHTQTSIAGIDEAGRGPLAGPVVAAAVIFKGPVSCVLGDSKSLSHSDKEDSFRHISQHHHWSVGLVSAKEIDVLNIRMATLLAMKRALMLLPITPTQVLIDGRDTIDTTLPQQAIIKGDQLVPEIQAASIIAKVYRDRIMDMIAALYPSYGFSQHKGYGTAYHRQAINSLGPCPQHRMSFAPMREMV